jgi:predicted RNA-binding protein with PIN domain
MDGHNMIFALPELQRFQVSGRREEARAGLSARLERFALARAEKVLVVFDGNRIRSVHDTSPSPYFEIVYTRPGEGVADDRILREARRLSGQGGVVTVVTNDVATLASRLPRAVRHLGVEEFWLKHVEKRSAADDDPGHDKRVAGDFSDIESEMLRQAALTEFAVKVRAPGPAPGGTRPATAGTRASSTKPDAAPHRLALKKARGRARQERRLKGRLTGRRKA